MDNKLKKLKGFTIIELLVVIVIITVLASIGVPAAMTWIRDSKITKANSNAQLVYSAAQDHLTQLEIKNVSLSSAGADGYIYCAADSVFEVIDNNGVIQSSSAKAAINVPRKFVDLTSTLGESFDGVWAVKFNPETYTVRYAWWTENTGNVSLYNVSILTSPYATYNAQEADYRSTGMLIGQFPIQ